jgi:hypothetical protein
VGLAVAGQYPAELEVEESFDRLELLVPGMPVEGPGS